MVLGLLKTILYSARKQPVVATAFLAPLLCWWISPIPFVLSVVSFSVLPKFVRGIVNYLMTLGVLQTCFGSGKVSRLPGHGIEQ